MNHLRFESFEILDLFSRYCDNEKIVQPSSICNKIVNHVLRKCRTLIFRSHKILELFSVCTSSDARGMPMVVKTFKNKSN